MGGKEEMGRRKHSRGAEIGLSGGGAGGAGIYMLLDCQRRGYSEGNKYGLMIKESR